MEFVRVYLTNAHRTSGGNGPGVVVIAKHEAVPLVASRFAQILGPATDDDAAGSVASAEPVVPPPGGEQLMSQNPRIVLTDAYLPDGRRVPKGTYLGRSAGLAA